MTRVALLDRCVADISGPDAASFLEGQLSQHVAEMVEGESGLAFLLEPNGKVNALLRVTRMAPEQFLLDTDAGVEEQVSARLTRFKLRTKVDVDVRRATCKRILDAQEHGLPIGLPGVVARDFFDGIHDPAGSDGQIIDTIEYEYWRVSRGVPVTGIDVDTKTIPEETGLVALAVDFTKGCYTGQELVARIDSRGHVNRYLRRLQWDGSTGVTAGTTLSADGKDVGSVTSAVTWRDRGAALAYLRREVEEGAVLRISGADDSAPPIVVLPPLS